MIFFKEYIPFDILITKDKEGIVLLKWVKGIGYVNIEKIFFEAYKSSEKEVSDLINNRQMDKNVMRLR